MSALKRPNVFRWHSFSFHWKAFTEAFIALWIRASCLVGIWNSMRNSVHLPVPGLRLPVAVPDFNYFLSSLFHGMTSKWPDIRKCTHLWVVDFPSWDGRPLFFTNKQGFLISLFPGMGICSPGPGYRHRTGEPSSSALILEVVKGFDGGPHPYSRGYWQLSIKAWQPSIKACI